MSRGGFVPVFFIQNTVNVLIEPHVFLFYPLVECGYMSERESASFREFGAFMVSNSYFTQFIEIFYKSGTQFFYLTPYVIVFKNLAKSLNRILPL